MEMKTINLNGVWCIKNEDQRVKRWKSFSYKHVYESDVKNWRDLGGGQKLQICLKNQDK